MRMPDPGPVETFSHLVRSIRDTHPNLAFIHVPEPRVAGATDREPSENESNDFLREIWLRGASFSVICIVLTTPTLIVSLRSQRTANLITGCTSARAVIMLLMRSVWLMKKGTL